jgi:hypothetical protein
MRACAPACSTSFGNASSELPRAVALAIRLLNTALRSCGSIARKSLSSSRAYQTSRTSMAAKSRIFRR